VVRATRVGIIAHRGASGHAPENTAAALELAIELGATAIEIDVQLTRDGHLIVWHDDTIERTAHNPKTPSHSRVRDLTLDELSACDVGSWFNHGYPLLASDGYENLAPMTLDDVLSTYGTRLPLFVEPKGIAHSPSMIRELARSLRSTGSPHRHAVLAHRPDCLETLMAECPDMEPVLLVDQMWPSGDDRVETAARLGAAISPHKDLVDARLVAHAHYNDVAVYPHTVNHPGEIRRLVELDVEAIITDLPDHVSSVLRHGTVRDPLASPARPA
jgi:glycerophosphoryl diester phosphodiesterase